MTWSCKHCELEFEFETLNQKGSHARWCDKNPNITQLKIDNALRKTSDHNKKFGKVQEFNVSCGTCGDNFIINERSKLFPQKEQYYCQKSCANAVGGRAKAAKHHPDSSATYTVVCFRHHKRRCVVCDEQNVVAVHHMNKDHNDNRPENLIPLCPTHHIYMHSRHKKLIEGAVLEYINKWKLEAQHNLGLVYG